MTDATVTYQIRSFGLWRTTHRVSGPGGDVGVLTIERGRTGAVRGGSFRPERGDVLSIRRDPGLLRSQFSLWTEGQEWLGSSLRWHLLRREIVLHTGSKPLRLVPLPGFRPGWSLQAPKTGEVARLTGSLLSRRSRLDVFRKLDLELLVFTYFLAGQLLLESIWPGPELADPGRLAAPPRALRS